MKVFVSSLATRVPLSKKKKNKITNSETNKKKHLNENNIWRIKSLMTLRILSFTVKKTALF